MIWQPQRSTQSRASAASDVYKRQDIKDVFRNIPWRAMFILTLFLFTTLAMWGSAMNYYFENYVDANALYTFLDKLGLVAVEANASLSYNILNAFGLIVNGPEKAYEVGFGAVSYTHLRAHETRLDLVCRLLLEKKK